MIEKEIDRIGKCLLVSEAALLIVLVKCFPAPHVRLSCMHAFRKLQDCFGIGVKSSEKAVMLKQLDRREVLCCFIA